MVKQESSVLPSSTTPVNPAKRTSYYRLLLEEVGAKPRKSMLPDPVAKPFRKLLVSIANLADDPGAHRWFWSKRQWWVDVFPMEERERLLTLRDQLREVWRLKTLPAETGLNYVVQSSGILGKGIRKILTEEESQEILDKAESQLDENLQGFPARRRRLIALHKALEMGLIHLRDEELASLWDRRIVVQEQRLGRLPRPQHVTLSEWIDSIYDKSAAGPMFLWRQGKILPDPFNLRVMLALAVADNAKRFARCQNPSCPASYFLKNRQTQKYCERGCAKYAQRQCSLAWWNREGKRRRERKRKSKNRKFQE